MDDWRDLGGLRTSRRRTIRRGALVRARTLDDPTDDGWAAIHELGVRTLIDLRNDDEKTATPSPPGITAMHLPLDGDDREFWDEWASDWRFGTPVYYAPHLARFPERSAAVLEAIAERAARRSAVPPPGRPRPYRDDRHARARARRRGATRTSRRTTSSAPPSPPSWPDSRARAPGARRAAEHARGARSLVRLRAGARCAARAATRRGRRSRRSRLRPARPARPAASRPRPRRPAGRPGSPRRSARPSRTGARGRPRRGWRRRRPGASMPASSSHASNGRERGTARSASASASGCSWAESRWCRTRYDRLVPLLGHVRRAVGLDEALHAAVAQALGDARPSAPGRVRGRGRRRAS